MRTTNTCEWDEGFDAFFDSEGDEDRWASALYNESDEWFCGWIAAIAYCGDQHD